MEKIGVMAVVEELAKFQGDMGKIDSAIAGIVPTSGLLGSTLSTLGDIASSVGSWIANTLAVAIGNLLADAVEWATQKLQELVQSAIDAGNEFQALEIRLNQMNFNTATDSGMEYADAMAVATEQTKEQLLWIQKLATVTPFELADISKVYGMARSYGFADTEAQDLVSTLGDFTAGMGLSGDAMVSIIRQFGQMRNTGKILQKDLNALAEGGMVPVNKILDIMKEKTGKTGKEFDAFKTSADGAKMFLEVFTNYVKNNYTGAAENANRTLKNATITLKEFFSSFAASNVVKPIMDIIGGRIADLNDQLQARLPDIISAFSRIGTALSTILTDVLDLGPSAGDMADIFVNGLNGIADWLTAHATDIVDFFKGARDFVTESLIPKLKELRDWLLGKNFSGMGPSQPGFLEKIVQNIKDMQPLIAPIKELFNSILKVGAAVMNVDLGEIGERSFAQNVQSVADSISWLAGVIDRNSETIAFFIKLFVTFSIIAGVVSSILSVVVSVVTSLAGVWVTFLLIAKVVVGVFTLFSGTLGAVIVVIAGVIAQVLIMKAVFALWFEQAKIIVNGIIEWFNYLKQNLIDTFHNIGVALYSGDWMGIGVAIITGMANGILATLYYLTNTMYKLAQNAIDAVKNFLGISSPSTVFFDIGTMVVEGFVNGIIGTMLALIGSLVAAFTAWIAPTLAAIAAWIAATISRVVEWAIAFVAKVNELKQNVINKFQELVNGIKEKLNAIKQAIIDAFQKALDAVNGINFFQAGRNIINGIIEGVTSGAGALASAVESAAQRALDALQGALQISSPSKLTMEIGMQFDQGLAMGIEKYANLVSAASKGVAATSLAPMWSTPAAVSNVSNVSNNQSTVNKNFNLNVNTSANTEPIIQDFSMMQAVIG